MSKTSISKMLGTLFHAAGIKIQLQKTWRKFRDMKWKLGAAVMTVVFIVAFIPAIISGVKGVSFGFSSSNELVFQQGNNRAMYEGELVTLGEDGRGIVYTDTSGEVMLPMAKTAEALGMEVEWDGVTSDATIKSDEISAKVTVVYPENQEVGANIPVYMSANEFAKAIGWNVTTSEYYTVLSSDETSEKDMTKLSNELTELVGAPEGYLLKNSLIFRAGSDHVMKNGEEAEFVDAEGTSYAPVVENSQYYLPVNALATLLGGSSKQTESGVEATILEKTITIDSEGNAKLDGKKIDGAGLVQEDVYYVSAVNLCDMIEYEQVGKGDIFMMSETSYVAADTQIATLTAMAEQLPDKHPPIPEADAYVALTFDDGPTGGSSGLTARLLDGLKERNAHATFFMCGYRIKDFNTHMDRYLAEGHEIANHTMDHPGVLTKKDYNTIVDQIQSNTELINSYCGQDPTLFRPVGGEINDDVKKAAEACGLPIINWSVDTEDWKYRDAERIKNVIVNQAKDGDVVLMHDLRECTLEGTLAAIDILTEKGYAFVTVSELAEIKGVDLQPGVKYTGFTDSLVQKINAA